MLTCALSSFVCATATYRVCWSFKVVCPQNSTKNIPRSGKVFTVSSILKLCDSKCSLICEETIKSSSPEPTIANYIRDTSSIPIYLMRLGGTHPFTTCVFPSPRVKITLADRYYRWNAALKLARFFFGLESTFIRRSKCARAGSRWRFS